MIERLEFELCYNLGNGSLVVIRYVKASLAVFWQFLLLGLVSFGGPAAHIGYFQKAFVERLQWLDQHQYNNLISLSQFLPGPGSSQMGFAIGVQRAGLFGGIAAFLGFTLPSFLLMYTLAITTLSNDSILLSGVIHGLKLMAVVVVADACLTMFSTFCKQKSSMMICVLSAVVLLVIPSMVSQIILLILAAIFGIFAYKIEQPSSIAPIRISKVPLMIFGLLFLVVPLFGANSQWVSLFSGFYTSGSLVFGGGHVVLPLLQETIGDQVSTDTFLLGYASAQAVPGPMFSLSAFLGAKLMTDSAMLGAMVATAAIFLPGFLLMYALLGSWQNIAKRPQVAGAVWGINAAVVGLLISALYSPVFISGVLSSIDFAAVLIGFLLLRKFNVAILWLVIGYALYGLLLNLFGF